MIINFGHNNSVIFVTRGPGGDDSQWPGDDQRHDDDDEGIFPAQPGFGIRTLSEDDGTFLKKTVR